MTIDLSTRYLGLKLLNPLVASANPLCGQLDTLRELEESGVAAVVLPSLFEEQIEHEEMELARLRDFGAEGFAEALDYFPEMEDYNAGPDSYLTHIERAKEALAIPVIASLNGVTPGGWVKYAKLFELAGADAVELNIYFLATSPEDDADAIEQRYVELVEAVRAELEIPLAVKIHPYFSSLPHMAERLKDAGADGLVLFNRFLQPDIDIETLSVQPSMELSTSAEVRLPLRWIAILKGRVDVCLAATTGAHTAEDVAKLLLAGADVTMMASALLHRGTSHPATVLAGLRGWMEEKEYGSVEQMKGSLSQQHSPDPEQFERGQYMKALTSYTSPLHP